MLGNGVVSHAVSVMPRTLDQNSKEWYDVAAAQARALLVVLAQCEREARLLKSPLTANLIKLGIEHLSDEFEIVPVAKNDGN
jgi:hypothetical protein